MKRNKQLIGVLTFLFLLMGVLWYYNQSTSQNQLQKKKEIEHVYMYYSKDVFNSNHDIYELLDKDYIKSLQKIFNTDVKKLSNRAEAYGLAPWVHIEFQYTDGTSDTFYVYLDYMIESVGYYHMKDPKPSNRYKITPEEFVHILNFNGYESRNLSNPNGN